MKSLKNQMALVGCLVALAACSTPQVKEFSNTADPNVEIAHVNGELTEAINNQVDVLSPANFKKATASLDDARKARESGKDQTQILHKIALSQAYLNKALEVAKTSEQVLPGVIRERHNALVAEAPKYFSKEFSAADSTLKGLTEKIEGNNTSAAAKERDDLEARYSAIELNSIKETKLGEARALLAQAKKEGAKKMTPQTLAWAEKKISSDEAIISAIRHNSTEVDKASADAKAAGQRILRLVREAKYSSELTPEQQATQLERDRTAALEAENASTLKLEQAQQTQAQSNLDLANKKETIATMTVENDKLQNQTRLEREYESARQQFSSNEADVYKQGDKLLLRLKGLSFPKDQAVIVDSNYSILAKVQKIIKESGPSNVVIEGHTDSTGSKAINDKLSAERAEAVGNYIKANNAILADKISAKGFGYSKPIATNKTSAGRAQNRRVDIVITTE